jgi:Papain-like cysteine protease AvrRpt2
MLTRETQQQTNWCWAACLRMAASAFDITAPDQCTLATQFLPGASDCCSDGSTDACNQALDEHEIPNLYSSIALVADALASSGAPITEAMVRMAASHGFALLMLDLGTAFHFVVVESVNGPTFQVADPNPDFSDAIAVGWNDLKTGYGNGNIAQAWRVHQP